MAEKSSEKIPVVQEPIADPRRSNSLDRDHELPSYQDSTPGPSMLQPQPTGSSIASHTISSPIGPTVSSPFNFPSTPSTTELAPPDYTSTSSRPIAIPQQFPQATAPFLPAFAPVLLEYGIPASSWYNFVDTTSAFLTAKVGQRAVSHAGDIAASVGRVPKKFGKDIANHAKDTFRSIGHSAKQGNPVGVIGGVIGGAIGLTLGTTFKVIHSTMSLPGTAIAAGAKPKTPQERVQAYAAAANKDWFHKRALHAELLNTAELAVLLGVSVQQLLDAAHSSSTSAEDQMNSLKDLIEGVELRNAKAKEPKSMSEPATPPALSPSGFPADVKQQPEDLYPANEVGSSSASSSKAPAMRMPDGPTGLHLSVETLWLVLRRDMQPGIPKAI